MARILENWNLVITKRVYVTGYYINSRPSVQAWMGGFIRFPRMLNFFLKARRDGEGWPTARPR